jgi:hypothetical protein
MKKHMGGLQVQQKKKTNQADRCVSLADSQSGSFTFGLAVRYTRKLYKLSPGYAAKLYSKITGRHATGRHIQRMEQTDSFFPRNPNRRWVFAKLLGMPAALMALVGLDEHKPPEPQQSNIVIPGPPRSVNVEAYYTKLQSYWVDGYPDGIEQAIDEIKTRIDRLHDVLPYSRQKPQIVRLLCGYQIVLADIAEGLQCGKAAKAYYTHAILLAEEYKCRDLLGIALFRRQAFFDDTGDFPSSQADFEQAKKQGYFVSPLLQGQMFSVAGRSQAALAQNQKEYSVALSSLDAAEKLTGQPEKSHFLFFAAFDKERYFLDRAATLTNSPNKKLRSPEKAEECLVEARRQCRIAGKGISTYRQAHSDFIQAKIYCDQGYDAVAATTAENVLHTLQGYGFIPSFCLKNIADLLQDLKQRAPGEDFVASLEAELMKWQHPYLFN